MSEDRRSRSRSRSRSPERGGDNGDNNAPPSDNGPAADDNNNAPAAGAGDNGGENPDEVKLYVGNLDYCELILWTSVIIIDGWNDVQAILTWPVRVD